MKSLSSTLTTTTILALGLSAPPAYAQDDDDIMVMQSAFSVAETVDRLAAALDGAEAISILGRLDHAQNAASVDLELPPNEVIIFGNPTLGTPLIAANPAMGLELPLRASAWEDAAGTVWIAAPNPLSWEDDYDLEDQRQVLEQIAGALEMLLSAASQPDE